MIEKRFELDCCGIFDNKTNHFYYKTFDNEEVVDLLNEQQIIINKLEQENMDRLADKIRTIDDFEKCINKLKKKILEQQSTIEHLKKRLYVFEKRKIIEESEIDENVIPKVKMLRTELFGEKYE